jgi:Tol biopolymer transport system component
MQSPSGQSRESEIWIYDLVRRTPIQLTFSEGADRKPVWSPDGQRIVFASLRNGAPGLYVTAAGGGPEERLLPAESRIWEEHWPVDWSPAGILFESGKNRESSELWLLPVDGDRKLRRVGVAQVAVPDAKLSPAGDWIAYVHRDLSTNRPPDVYVESLATKGVIKRVSTAGGAAPEWRSDGRELFYLADDGYLMAVPVEADATNLRLGKAETLFQTGLAIGGRASLLEASADGQRFLLRMPDKEASTASIVVLSNWPAFVKGKQN